MATNNATPGVPTDTSDREMVFTREFNAPRELVFDAWTRPEHVTKWWGPHGFTTTIHEMDVRPGGVWRFIMHDPDGTNYPNRIVFREVQRPERLVYQHEGENSVNFEVTVTFENQGSQTRLTMRMLFPSVEALQFVVTRYGAEEGARQTLSRLADYVASFTR